jgi:hypothetical protein
MNAYLPALPMNRTYGELVNCCGRAVSIRGADCRCVRKSDVSNSTAAFVDTSIQIARLIHSPETRQEIDNRLQSFELITTGLIVRQEFKRRLLKDARYLLELFQKYQSFAKVQRHIVDVLTPHQRRKQRISLELLTTIFEDDSDVDLTRRATLLLEGLLRDGLYEFEESVGHIVEKSQCGCARQDIRRRGKRYDFGEEKCSKVAECGIAEFLESRRPQIQRILARLQAISAGELTDELARAAEFIRSFLDSSTRIRNRDPCKTVGDLLIALESVGVPTFYTMNGKESQHLCRALEQDLVVRPANSSKSDIECRSDEAQWPLF